MYMVPLFSISGRPSTMYAMIHTSESSPLDNVEDGQDDLGLRGLSCLVSAVCVIELRGCPDRGLRATRAPTHTP